MVDWTHAQFWTAVAQIIAIDLVLSGDNAVVIALACRNLTPAQRRWGLFWGVGGAVGLRIVLTAGAAFLLALPWLKLFGGLLLLWIGVKLLLPDDDDDAPALHGAQHIWGAVRTIVVADFVMSLDNVVAVAGAAGHSVFLLVLGLAVSIPIIIGASQLIMRLMDRFPQLVWLGAGLIGWVAGSMMSQDPGLLHHGYAPSAWRVSMASVLGALGVVGLGLGLARRRLRGG